VLVNASLSIRATITSSTLSLGMRPLETKILTRAGIGTEQT